MVKKKNDPGQLLGWNIEKIEFSGARSLKNELAKSIDACI